MILEEVVDLVQLVNGSQLAKEADVNRKTITRLKQGQHDPGLSVAERIVNSLGYELVLKRKEEPPQQQWLDHLVAKKERYETERKQSERAS